MRERAVRSGVQDQAMLHEWRVLPALQVYSMTSTMECLGEVMARGGVSWAGPGGDVGRARGGSPGKNLQDFSTYLGRNCVFLPLVSD